MVLFVLLIAVLNLGLGYAVAVRLGRRYRALLARELAPDPLAALMLGVAGRPPAPEAPPPADQPDTEAGDVGARLELIDGWLGETAEYRALLDEAHQIAENESGQLDSSEQAEWFYRLSEGTDAYLDRRHACEADLHTLMEDEEVCEQRETFHSTWEQQGAQLRRMSDTAGQAAVAPDPGQHWEPLGREINDLLATTSDVDALLGEARSSLDGDRSGADPAADAAAAPAEAENPLKRWYAESEDPDAHPCVALVDVDHVEQLNQRYGRALVDQILAPIYKLAEGEQSNGATVERIDNQRFVLTFSDPEAQRAANIVERLRQKIGKMRFACGDREIQATVSGAVAGPAPDDDADSLLTRVTATLAEAKHYGRNRTFLHRGDFPAPVVPPPLSLDETRILLDAGGQAEEMAAPAERR